MCNFKLDDTSDWRSELHGDGTYQWNVVHVHGDPFWHRYRFIGLGFFSGDLSWNDSFGHPNRRIRRHGRDRSELYC